MLRIIQSGNALPISFAVDPNAQFEPGQIAQLTVVGNQITCGVSDGTAPIGIIDDIKTTAFSSSAIDEVIIVPVAGVSGPNNTIITPVDVTATLENPNVLSTSFISNPVDVELVSKNGVIIFLAGTQLNYDMDGDGIPDSIRTVVSYSYQIPNIPGDDSTMSSGKVTVWFQRMLAATDQFETNQRYPVNAPLFVNESGKLTTRQISPDHPAIALVTGPPNSVDTTLEFMLL